MNDLLTIAVASACLIATLALIRLCDWLTPRVTPGHGSSPNRTESRP